MDDSMKYEELLCKLFDCGQDGDPLQYASSAVYDDNILEIDEGKGYELRAGLFSAIRQYQLKYVEGASNSIDDFADSWDEAEYWTEKCFTTKDQIDIDKIVKVLDDLVEEKERNKA